MKKVTKKSIIAEMLEEELKKDSRFARMNFETAFSVVKSLRKTKNANLPPKTYALWVAYNRGLSEFCEYKDNFVVKFDNCIEDFKNKIKFYGSLVNAFNSVEKEVLRKEKKAIMASKSVK